MILPISSECSSMIVDRQMATESLIRNYSVIYKIVSLYSRARTVSNKRQLVKEEVNFLFKRSSQKNIVRISK